MEFRGVVRFSGSGGVDAAGDDLEPGFALLNIWPDIRVPSSIAAIQRSMNALVISRFRDVTPVDPIIFENLWTERLKSHL